MTKAEILFVAKAMGIVGNAWKVMLKKLSSLQPI